MRTTQQCTNVLFLSSFIDTVLMLGFSNLKKRHLLGQRRVAVLSSEIVPVYSDSPVSITDIRPKTAPPQVGEMMPKRRKNTTFRPEKRRRFSGPDVPISEGRSP